VIGDVAVYRSKAAHVVGSSMDVPFYRQKLEKPDRLLGHWICPETSYLDSFWDPGGFGLNSLTASSQS
jgi:hypothetical protein